MKLAVRISLLISDASKAITGPLLNYYIHKDHSTKTHQPTVPKEQVRCMVVHLARLAY